MKIYKEINLLEAVAKASSGKAYVIKPIAQDTTISDLQDAVAFVTEDEERESDYELPF